jgi:hypothetical protein
MKKTEFEFMVGDVVKLAGAAGAAEDVLKTVVAVSRKGVTCAWDAAGKPQRATYPASALVLVKRGDGS